MKNNWIEWNQTPQPTGFLIGWRDVERVLDFQPPFPLGGWEAILYLVFRSCRSIRCMEPANGSVRLFIGGVNSIG